MIDHTLLKPDATRKNIEDLCREAAQFKFATVCVNPAWVALSARLLTGSGVGVCSVVGFPLGATLVSADEARAIVTMWLTTPMREPRYIRRLAKIRDLEQ